MLSNRNWIAKDRGEESGRAVAVPNRDGLLTPLQGWILREIVQWKSRLKYPLQALMKQPDSLLLFLEGKKHSFNNSQWDKLFPHIFNVSA